MIPFAKKTISVAVLLAGSQLATAGTGLFFNPLVQSTGIVPPNHVNELTAPRQVPAGISQMKVTSLSDLEADPASSVVRVDGLGSVASMWDMAAFDPSGRYIFIPHETKYGAGLTRYDTVTRQAEVLFRGDTNGSHGDWSNDFGALDPATWTPNGTLLLGEEWSGQGRLFEVVNPLDPADRIQVRELTDVPNVSHEGLRFNHAGTALYFVDEDKSGSIYKYVPSRAGDYGRGQSFVLKVDAFAGDPALHWNDPANTGAVRTGLAHWVPLTDAQGRALPSLSHDPFLDGPAHSRDPSLVRGGRAAADDVGATPFGRPEDVEVGYLANGNEVVYFNATSEQALYSVEELGDGQAMVRLAASETATPKNLGYPATTARLNSPDNLAQDALGNIYIVEDAPNGDRTGGDIWFVRDTNGDGVAESLDHFMSLQVDGSENTGMIFNPARPTQFIVNVQHPTSTDRTKVADGQGDALWVYDLKGVVAPPCLRTEDEGDDEAAVRTCGEDANFVERLSGRDDK